VLSANLTLSDSRGADHEFHLISQVKQDTLRTDIGVAPIAPCTLAIKHAPSGKGIGLIDRHLVQYQKLVSSTDPAPLIVNLTMAVPRNWSGDILDVQDAVSEILSALTANTLVFVDADWDNLAAVLRGES
jgi:hypothetical protein